MTVRLEELLAAATDGPWRASTLESPHYVVQVPEHVGQPVIADQCDSHETARLIALAPDAVRLLIDMGDALRCENFTRDPREPARCNSPEEPLCDSCSLLARLERLGT